MEAVALPSVSEMQGVAQLQVVLPGVGFFDAAVGAVLQAQLPFVLVRISVVKTDGQVRHKVLAGTHFLVARGKARAGVTGAHAPFDKPGAMAAIRP